MFKRSNKENFLLEIGTEELPPNSLRTLAGALHDKICEGIRSANLNFISSQLYAGPRRIAVLLKSLEPMQAAQDIEKRGPALKAAYNADGSPTKATEGFAASCGVTIEQLGKLETDKGSWLVYRSTQAGKTSMELLPEIINNALNNLPINKKMRWNAHDFEFVRPVHWLLAIYGSEIVPLTAFGKTASNISYGHRFLAPNAIKIKAPEKYADQLQKTGKVLVDFKTRRETIKHQIFNLSESLNATPLLDEKLLDEVTNLVEWPTALLANFDKTFLTIPQAVLTASMQQHQKCFALHDANGEMLPQFITISNIESKDPERIIAGNERVMQARLSDAKFFYEQDLKTPLITRVDKLQTITFEEKLGSLFDRVTRIGEVSKIIADVLQADQQKIARVALLCKADLASSMVGEFPELQGIMGYYYAKHDGEAVDVAIAIRDHYKPCFATDSISKDQLAYIIGIADKMDLIVGIFGIGDKPTGDKDPYGLRRATLGVIRTIIENHLELDLAALINASIQSYGKKLTNPDTFTDVLRFMYERLRMWYKDQNVNNYVFNAVLAKEPTNLQDFAKRVNAVISFKRLPEALSLTESNKRVVNILAKNAAELSTGKVNTSLLVEPAEKALHEAIDEKFKTANDFYQQQHYTETLKSLVSLKKPIDQFFESVMVMAEDKQLQQNRLLLLKQLRDLFALVADISQLQ